MKNFTVENVNAGDLVEISGEIFLVFHNVWQDKWCLVNLVKGIGGSMKDKSELCKQMNACDVERSSAEKAALFLAAK